MTHAQFIDQQKKLQGLNGLLAYVYTAALIQFKAKYPEGPRPMLDTTYRTNTEQDKLYAQGRSKPGTVVTYKRGGESNHNKFPSPACDIKMVYEDGRVTWEPEIFEAFYKCMESVNVKIVWGGHWSKLRDLPHFELV